MFKIFRRIHNLRYFFEQRMNSIGVQLSGCDLQKSAEHSSADGGNAVVDNNIHNADITAVSVPSKRALKRVSTLSGLTSHYRALVSNVYIPFRSSTFLQ